MKRLKTIEIEDKSEINLSPLIDMMFLLLIFFIVTTAFIEETGIKINKPQASNSKKLKKQSIMLTIKKSGLIYYKDQHIPFNNLRGIIANILQEELKPVILIASGNLKTKQLIKILDECKTAGAEDVSIATSPNEINNEN